MRIRSPTVVVHDTGGAEYDSPSSNPRSDTKVDILVIKKYLIVKKSYLSEYFSLDY
jgi:hypothetical protein